VAADFEAVRVACAVVAALVAVAAALTLRASMAGTGIRLVLIA
jgi:hypothetical protein